MPVKDIEKKTDERGWLAEIVKNSDLPKKEFGQVFVTTAKPGINKGGHYHTRKHEYFCVIKGKAEITLKELDKNENVLSTEIVNVDEQDLKLVELLPWVWHAIENTGEEEMVLLVYVDEEFNPEDTDTFRG